MASSPFQTMVGESEGSQVFAVQGEGVEDWGFEKLLESMAMGGLKFYRSSKEGPTWGPEGLLGPEDLVLLKVNSQWDERGGTNTDLVASVIEAVLAHPEGWRGELVVVDNGQAQYGATGRGGSFSYARNNAKDRSQSIEKVVNRFQDRGVSSYLWDRITENAVGEYAEGDLEDGYVVETALVARTGTVVSYPKFTTALGTLVSFKHGVYDPKTERYHPEKVKLINIPVLKSHMIYGVTGAVKSYMGVPSDKLSAALGHRIHSAIAKGALGTLMASTRTPTLNLMDAVYVNARPRDGPRTPYSHATRADTLAACTDPFALDYWASKSILCKKCVEQGLDPSTMDPDNTGPRAFGEWLRLSLEELRVAGYNFTLDPERIQVHMS